MMPRYIVAAPEDNVAIVPERLEAGDGFPVEGAPVVMAHAILQGHRICTRAIPAGDPLLSWGMPFGTALVDIAPGDYICNAKMREVLLERSASDFPAGSEPRVNFSDRDTVAELTLPEAPVHGANAPSQLDARTFAGYFRGPLRGWGTRNVLAVIGTTSRSRAAVLAAVEELNRMHPAAAGFDGVVPVVHTEGGGTQAPANTELLLRTLAGFAVNPNVGAAVVVGDPAAPITNRDVLAALGRLPHSPHEYTVRFCDVPDTSPDSIARIVAAADSVAGKATRSERADAPLSALKIGMQCGGSDAFSGVSANPVLGRAMDLLIDHGGTVGIAETDELIGSEAYTLARVRNAAVAEDFLRIQRRFKDYAEAHGHTAEGNVSGGNIYRGLYNITLKSLGAARKKDPGTALDHVIDYAEPMTEPGFYFMDSPGNDLESIAGQVASGANLIIFTTGNGSITNFPFVPTIKVVTTTARFEHLESDMDCNAGTILEGASLESEGQELFELTLATASGRRTKGEGSRQSQTQIWRSWRTVSGTGASAADVPRPEQFTRAPLIPSRSHDSGPAEGPVEHAARQTPDVVGARYDLILPTSLCSGQVGEQIARLVDDASGVDRRPVVALSHTEGCGVSSGDAEEILRDTLVGYAAHPLVAQSVFLEHGCEKTHNDFFRAAVDERGLDVDAFDWASIQGAGGIERATAEVTAALASGRAGSVSGGGGARPVIGVSTTDRSAGLHAAGVGDLVVRLLDAGASVIVSTQDPVLEQPAFRDALVSMNGAEVTMRPTIPHAGSMAAPGFHIMDDASTDWLETATGLGAAGATALLVLADEHPRQPHRFVPTIQIGTAGRAEGMDGMLDSESSDPELEQLLELLDAATTGDFRPATPPRANVGFQLSRGRFGISL